MVQESLLTIYPTARKIADQLARLSRGGCVLGYRFMTLPRVVDALWLEAADPRGGLSYLGERLVLREAVIRASADGAIPSLQAGISERTGSLIRQLKSAGLNPEEWRAAVETLPAPDRRRLEVFTRIFTAYKDVLEQRGLADQHDREAAAFELLDRMERAGSRPLLLEGVKQLLIAEIYDLSLLQFMTIAALIRIVGDAELNIQAAPHKVTARRFADLTWNRFVGEESIANQVLPAFVRRDGRRGQLGFLLEHLFTDEHPEPPPIDGSVRVIIAPNAREEAEAAARTIRKMLEDPGEKTPLHRIAIVARDLAPYEDHLEAAFRRVGLRLTRESGPALRISTPARAILEILRLVLDGLPREGLVALCDNTFMQITATRYRTLPREAGYIDREARPLLACLEQRERTLGEAFETTPSESRHRVASQLARLERGKSAWIELLEALQTLEHPATIADYADKLIQVLGWLGFDPTNGSLIDSAARATGPLWQTLDDLAGEARRVMPERVVTLREFAELVEAAFGDIRLEPAIADGADAVRAIPILEARGLDFEIVFILGLNDEVFPHYYRDDALVPDQIVRPLDRELRARLKTRLGARMPDVPGPILRTTAERNSEEPFLFFLAMSMPSRAIVLSCALEDDAGRPLRRSPFLDEVLDRIGGEGRLEKIAGGDFAPLAECFGERDFLNHLANRGQLTGLATNDLLVAERVAAIDRRIRIERERSAYFALPSREILFAERLRAHRNSSDWLAGTMRTPDPDKLLRASEYDGRVAPDERLTRALLETPDGAPRAWSAKQLTELAVCGFNFFARRLLHLSEADELEHEPTRLETGDVVHRILRDFFDARPDFDQPAAAFAKAAEVVERWRLSSAVDARDPAFFDLAWTAVHEMINEVVAFEIARRADGHLLGELEHEYRLDFPLELGPVAGIDRASIPIVGWIDRLELYRTEIGGRRGRDEIARIRAVDYKTSRSLDRLSKMLTPVRFATTDLQMPVYLLGAITQLRDLLATDTVVEASYIALQRREKETAPLRVPLELLDPSTAATASVAGRARELIGSALAGRFDADPLECSDWCPYRPVCRFDKAGSP